MHYDHNCASWRSQGRPENKSGPTSKASEAYAKAYLAMLEEDELSYDVHCATFNASPDLTPATTKAFMAQTMHKTPDPSISEELLLTESSWSSLPANTAELREDDDKPSESMYEASPVWEQPPGQAVQGIDAFKISCHVNNLKEPAVLAVGDSGTAPTLILQRFLDSLKASKPQQRAGSKLKLIQVTGSAKCSQYVHLNLYFRSQLGPVCLKGVEAYMVQGMEADLLIGEDTQLAWNLSTMLEDSKSYWKVGKSLHCIPGQMTS